MLLLLLLLLLLLFPATAAAARSIPQTDSKEALMPQEEADVRGDDREGHGEGVWGQLSQPQHRMLQMLQRCGGRGGLSPQTAGHLRYSKGAWV